MKKNHLRIVLFFLTFSSLLFAQVELITEADLAKVTSSTSSIWIKSESLVNANFLKLFNEKVKTNQYLTLYFTDTVVNYDPGLMAVLPLNLQQLEISKAGVITDAALTTFLTNHNNLSALVLQNAGQITDNALVNGISKCLNMNVLKLNNTQITENGLKALVGFKTLQRLGISYSKITDAGFSTLLAANPFPMLNELIADGTQFGVQSALALPKTTILYISAGDSAVNDDVLKALAKVPNIKKIYVHKTKITAAGLAALPGTGLQLLSVNDNPLLPAAFTEIAKISSLLGLYMANTGANDESVRTVRAISGMREIDLRNNPGITDAAAASVGRFYSLERVWTTGTGLLDASLSSRTRALRNPSWGYM